MIQVFVPLILLTIVGLLIFSSENGVYNNEFNILTYRLVNVGSLMVAFVSLIPVIRENMPPMPGVTLIQVITYICTAPNLLAIISSLISYEISTTEWLATYTVWKDALFIISFIITLIALCFLILLVAVYMFKEYTMNSSFKIPKEHKRKKMIKYRSPRYL